MTFHNYQFERRSYEFKRRSYGFKRSSYGFKRSSYGFKRSSYGFKRSSYGFERSSYGFERSSYGFSHCYRSSGEGLQGECATYACSGIGINPMAEPPCIGRGTEEVLAISGDVFAVLSETKLEVLGRLRRSRFGCHLRLTHRQDACGMASEGTETFAALNFREFQSQRIWVPARTWGRDKSNRLTI